MWRSFSCTTSVSSQAVVITQVQSRTRLCLPICHYLSPSNHYHALSNNNTFPSSQTSFHTSNVASSSSLKSLSPASPSTSIRPVSIPHASFSSSSSSSSSSSIPPVAVTPYPKALPDSPYAPYPSFAQLRVHPSLCKRLLQSELHVPSLIQIAAIPWLMRKPLLPLTPEQDKMTASLPDVLMQEQTGQGKTLAYLLPILSQISATIPAVQAIVVVPTRELALQVQHVIDDLLSSFPKHSPIVSMNLVGELNPYMISLLNRSHATRLAWNELNERASRRSQNKKANQTEEEDEPTLAETAHRILQEKTDAERGQLRQEQHEQHPPPSDAYGHQDEEGSYGDQDGTVDVLPPLPHPHILVGTPAILDTIFNEKKLLHADMLRYVVFDEIDQLLNSSKSRKFIVPLIQLRQQSYEALTSPQHPFRHIEQFPTQVAMVSATITRAVHEFAHKYLSYRKVFVTPASVPQLLQYKRGDRKLAKAALLAESSDSAASSSSSSSSTPSSSSSSSTHPDSQESGLTAKELLHMELTGMKPKLLSKEKEKEKEKQKPAVPEKNASPSASSAKSSSSAIAKSTDSSSIDLERRIPSDIRHFYLLIPHEFSRGKVLQDLTTAIKQQFTKYRATLPTAFNPVAQATTGSGKLRHIRVPKSMQVTQGPTSGAASLLAGGTTALGVGAIGAAMQTTLTFFNDSNTLKSNILPLSQKGFNMGVLHDFSSRSERRDTLKLGGNDLILCTDLLARGIDMKTLTHIINYQLPSSATQYLHRAGRVGRLGALHSARKGLGGHVITLLNAENVEDIQKYKDYLTSMNVPLHEVRRIYLSKPIEGHKDNGSITIMLDRKSELANLAVFDLSKWTNKLLQKHQLEQELRQEKLQKRESKQFVESLGAFKKQLQRDIERQQEAQLEEQLIQQEAAQKLLLEQGETFYSGIEADEQDEHQHQEETDATEHTTQTSTASSRRRRGPDRTKMAELEASVPEVSYSDFAVRIDDVDIPANAVKQSQDAEQREMRKKLGLAKGFVQTSDGFFTSKRQLKKK